MNAAALLQALLQILSTGTVFLTQFSELLPHLRTLADTDGLSPEQKAALDEALERYAETNRQLSATIQSYRLPA